MIRMNESPSFMLPVNLMLSATLYHSDEEPPILSELV